MRVLIRIVAVLAGVSVIGTMWFVVAFASAGGLGPLIRSGVLGVLTVMGWVIALTAGPLAAIQLWRLRESGRRAGILLFGSGVVYYLGGLVWLRSGAATVGPIIAAAVMFAAPLVVLLSQPARRLVARHGAGEAAPHNDVLRR